jgi:hypothetical protein
MDQRWDLKLCGGVNFHTAVALAFGLMAGRPFLWLPSIIFWDSLRYDNSDLETSNAFVSAYLRQDWR